MNVASTTSTTTTAAEATAAVEQAAALTVYVSCPSCGIHGRSGFTFHCFHNCKALRDLSESGMVQVAGSHGGGSEDSPPLCVQQSPPHTAFLTDSIQCSSNLAEPVFQFSVMAAPQSAVGDLVLP